MPLPKFPVTFVSVATGAEFDAHDMGALHQYLSMGGYQLKEPTPGVAHAVYEPPARTSTAAPEPRVPVLRRSDDPPADAPLPEPEPPKPARHSSRTRRTS